MYFNETKSETLKSKVGRFIEGSILIVGAIGGVGLVILMAKALMTHI